MRSERAAPPHLRMVEASISNAVVELHARAYGRGPTRAKTHIVERQFVLCLLGDPFTRAERTLIEVGRYDTVRDQRGVFHDCIEPQLRAAVERATGQTVTGFIGGVSIEADHVSQLFLLQAPRGPELQRISTTP